MPKSTAKRVAFVLDLNAGPESLVCYVLTSVVGRRNHWEVWKPQYKGHKAKDRSTRRYAHALFVLLSRAMAEAFSCPGGRGHPGESEQSERRFSFHRNDKQHSGWAKLLFDTVQAGPGKYGQIPATVRRGLQPLLTARGKRGTHGHARIEIALPCSDAVLFWDAASPSLLTKKLDTCADEHTALRLDCNAATGIGADIAHALSKQIPCPGRQETWQDLYRRLALEVDYAPSPRWIPATAKLMERAGTQSDSRPHTCVTPRQIIGLNKSVFLIGASGAGKTSALRALNYALLVQERGGDEMSFPVFIKLKEFEPTLIRAVEEQTGIDIAELVGKAIGVAVCRKRTMQYLHDSAVVRALVCKWCHLRTPAIASREDILNAFSREASMWFENEGMHDPSVVLLFDGINEIQPGLREALKDAMAPLIDRVDRTCKVVVSCRSNLAAEAMPEPRERMRVFELQPLSDSDITSYIDHAIPGQGEGIFETRIGSHEQMSALAKNPFFLSRLVEMLVEDVNIRPLPIKARLAQRLVHDCTRKKDTEGAATGTGGRHLAFSVLPYVAKWSIDGLTQSKGGVTSRSVFSDALIESRFSRTEVLEALDFAETCGLLATSGLFAGREDRFGYPVFIHDFVRDYFAAHYLLLQQRLAQVPQLESVLEYLEWDGALEMYYGLIQEPGHLHEDIRTLAEWDIFAAGRCLACCPITDEPTAQQFAATFSSARMRCLYSDDFTRGPFSIHTTLRHVLSRVRPATLNRLYLDTSTLDCIRDAIPGALLLALGPDALPHLQRFVSSFEFSDCSSAYGALCELRTAAAWELVSAQYIEFAQQSDEREPVFPYVLLVNCWNGISPDLILKQVRRARREMSACHCELRSIDRVVDTLLRTLHKVAPKYTDDLLELEKHPDKVVSEHASWVLLDKMHPKAVEAALEMVRGSPEPADWVFMNNWPVVSALCKVNDPDIDAELWRCFDKELDSSFLSFRKWWHLPHQLAERTDRRVLERLIRRCLPIDDWSVVDALKAFAERVPDVMLEVLCAEASATEPGTPLWHRLVVFRALCGDSSVKDELLAMLSDIRNIKWKNEYEYTQDWQELSAHVDNQTFRGRILEAVGQLMIPEAMPLLETIAREEPRDGVSHRAFDIVNDTKARLTNEYFRRQVRTKEQVTALANGIVETCVRDPRLRDWWYKEKASYARDWPTQTTEFFLCDLRDRIEESIGKEERSSVGRVYMLLAMVRAQLQRRHLKLFKGWPISPPPGWVNTSSADKKQTASHQSRKRRKS